MTNPVSQPFNTKWVDEDTGLVSWSWLKYLENQGDFLTQQFGSFTIRTATATDTITEDDIVILADTTTAPFTLTLPDPVVISEIDATTGQVLSKTYYIRNIGSTYPVTVETAGGLIDGLSQKILQPRVSQLFVTDGTNWYTLMSNPTRVETFTASGTWSWQGESAVEVVICGGGGGGGNAAGVDGGGGGAGGEVIVRKLVVAADVSVTVGDGGAAATAGNLSSFGNLTARGGNAGSGTTAGAAFAPDSTFGVNAPGGDGGTGAANGTTPSRVAGLGTPGTGGATAGGNGGGGGGGGSQGNGADGASGAGGSVGGSAAANSGGGGGGGRAANNGGVGGSGIVIVISL